MRTRPLSYIALHAAALAALLAASLAMLVAPAAQAQAGGGSDVIAGKALTTDSVLDALDPQAARTRSFKLGGSTAAPVRASASLLVTFETNSAELSATARQQLDVVATALKNDRLATYGFMVEGHADPRGEPDANLLLSQERAESVKRYLTTRHAIEPARLTAEGHGDREPLNRNVPAAPENRRVTFVTRQP
jgi:OOP family OmpA-OmpF porin